MSTINKSALQIRDEIDDELDNLAKARMEQTCEDFYTAYEAVCGTQEGIDLIKQRNDFHAVATGTASHGRQIDLSKRDESELPTLDLDMSLVKQSSNKALMKRAKVIQVECASQHLHLTDALALAKAESTNLTKSASF